MPKSDIVAARLDLIAAKAKILAEKYKNNQLWEGELTRDLNEISGEAAAIHREGGDRHDGWATTSSGWPGDR